MKNEKYKIETRIRFRYGHRLMKPYKGKCNNIHGEGGTAIFIFETDELDRSGMVIDFSIIKDKLRKWIDDNLDHSYICRDDDDVGKYLEENDFKVFKLGDNPTAENIAKLLYNKAYVMFPHIKKVGVIESFEDNIAWYENGKEK